MHLHKHVSIARLYVHERMATRVAFRKLRKGWGQICEQGNFEGAGLIRVPCAIGTRQTRGVWGHAPRSILVHCWPCITCILINPLHMRKRVTVVCLCVCVSVCYRSTLFVVHFYHPDMVLIANI